MYEMMNIISTLFPSYIHHIFSPQSPKCDFRLYLPHAPTDPYLNHQRTYLGMASEICPEWDSVICGVSGFHYLPKCGGEAGQYCCTYLECTLLDNHPFFGCECSSQKLCTGTSRSATLLLHDRFSGSHYHFKNHIQYPIDLGFGPFGVSCFLHYFR